MTNANADYEAWARHERCLALQDWPPATVVSRPHRMPSEAVVPTWVLLGQEEPEWSKRERAEREQAERKAG